MIRLVSQNNKWYLMIPITESKIQEIKNIIDLKKLKKGERK